MPELALQIIGTDSLGFPVRLHLLKHDYESLKSSRELVVPAGRKFPHLFVDPLLICEAEEQDLKAFHDPNNVALLN